MPKDDLSPSAVRALARARFADHIPTLDRIASDDDATDRSRIDAIRALGDFGLGKADQGAIHLHAEGGALMLGVVALPALQLDGATSGAADGRAVPALPPGSTPDPEG